MMNASLTLSGSRLPPAGGRKPRQLVVLLHGYGADGEDLLGLAPAWARLLPEAAFMAPNAPYPCEDNPAGCQWFGLWNRDPATLLAGAEAAAPLLNDYVDRALAENGLGPEALALVGFSQGTMMALHVALRRERAVGAVVGFSGALLAPEMLAAQVRARPPVLLVHGEADQVVPFRAMAQAEAALKAAGVPVTTHRRPGLAHGIDEAGLRLAVRFLGEAFGVDSERSAAT